MWSRIRPRCATSLGKSIAVAYSNSRSPREYQFATDRLIGSIRRELLDQVFFWNSVDLERKLRRFQRYFNQSRAHASLDGKTPAEVGGSVVTHPAALRNFTWEKHCGGLVELPVAA